MKFLPWEGLIPRLDYMLVIGMKSSSVLPVSSGVEVLGYTGVVSYRILSWGGGGNRMVAG